MPYKNISQVNAALRIINNNLNGLENILNDGGNFNAEHVRHVQDETNQLLQDVENASCRKILRTIKTRRKKRLCLKRRRKLENEQNKECPESSVTVLPVISDDTLHRSDVEPSKTDAFLLMKRADAQRFIDTFDLLEKLHQARSQNTSETNQLANKLSTLRGIWLHELRACMSPKAKHNSINKQWEEVLFGGSEPAEHRKFKDLLRIRHSWDSYISHSRSASSIPNGWVMPDTKSEWEKYQAQ